MIDKMKNNTKIKLISLTSAIVLWLYVMAVVDPEETRVLENLPVTINNMSELKANDLVLYPETELETDIYITGKLSYLQKIKPQDVHIYGTISDPIEGKNQLYLRASISERVSHSFKTNVMIVSVEKLIEEKRSIDLSIEGLSRDKIIESKSLSVDNVKISGPRSLVQQVQKVVATVDLKNRNTDFEQEIKLVPVDIEGKEVIGVDLDNEYVTVDFKLSKQKVVPIEIKIKEDSENIENLKNYKLSQNTITITGKNNIIDKIDKIYTKPIDLQNLIDTGSNNVELEIPKGLNIDNKTNITIEINIVDTLSKEFLYTSEDIEIRNNIDNIDISTLDIPKEIKVSFEYSSTITDLNKSDILLYIDLSQSTEDSKYEIKYETDNEINNVDIQPNTVNIKP